MPVVMRRDFAVLMGRTGMKLFSEGTENLEEEFIPFYHMDDTEEGAYKTEYGLVGMGPPIAAEEGEPVRYDQPMLGRPKTYIPQKFQLAVALSFESKEDDRFGKIAASVIPELSTSFKVERNELAADILNNAFTVMGYEPDGVALVANNHPSVNYPQTRSNLLTQALSTAGLQSARALLRLNRTESGKHRPLKPKYLIVGPSDESLARELVESSLKPGQYGSTAHTPNDINTEHGKLEVIVLNYLEDDGRYFLVSDKSQHKLEWWDRVRMRNWTINDYEAQVVKMIGMGRWTNGFTDWQGIVGYDPN